MRYLFYIMTVLLISCNSSLSDKDIEAKAMKITEQLDRKTIETFYEWNYYTRGGDNWTKISGDSALYTCSYSYNDDTTTLTIYRAERFVVDFPCSFNFDTLNYWRFSLKKSNDDLINIEGVNKGGRDIALTTKQKLTSLFNLTNPYDKFSSLNELKDKLEVIGITAYYNKGTGNYVQFFLSLQHILTYLPDSMRFNNDYLKEEFAKGKMLKKNWHFRKLDKPIDNG